jgi:hypothetical protein
MTKEDIMTENEQEKQQQQKSQLLSPGVGTAAAAAAAAGARRRLTESCTSITNCALSCRTTPLNSSSRMAQQRHRDNNNDDDQLLQQEIRTSQWLDRQIVNARAKANLLLLLCNNNKETTTTTTDHNPHTNDDYSSTTTPRQQQQQLHLQHELLDESIRQQQENLLYERIQMSNVIHRKHPLETDQQHDSHSLLSREAIRARDELVQSNLQILKQIESLQKEIYETQKKVLALQEQNRDLWDSLNTNNNAGDSTPFVDNTKQSTLATETMILKRVLQDILANSDLDWYSDPRLRKTIQRLES